MSELYLKGFLNTAGSVRKFRAVQVAHLHEQCQLDFLHLLLPDQQKQHGLEQHHKLQWGLHWVQMLCADQSVLEAWADLTTADQGWLPEMCLCQTHLPQVRQLIEMHPELGQCHC